MAKVSLRAYNREIETMIDRGQLDEAIAHCRHILKTYPKHLETYRLLGKAYLEYKRHGDAADIFSRILVSVPNDFVAQVGMSIIRDEENRLDDAIWHMERAFESQPSNPAIQSELQRLYARRDGVRPPRIRMTRGALAHMYVQGELYPQAISEIKSVLQEDESRADMQALLARACYKNGLRNEAADVASALLRRYPYSLDANRVLVEILGSDHPESTQLYRQRIYELDPYAAHVTGTVFQSNEVSDAAVNIERLDWNGQPVTMQPEWSESQAISLESDTSKEEEPDWLNRSTEDSAGLEDSGLGPAQPTPAPIFESKPPFEQPPAQSTDDIPDFMRAAGWGQSTGEVDESKQAFAEEDRSSDQAIEAGDLPDWVKAMKPVEAEPPAQDDEEELPDWINSIGAGALSTQTGGDEANWMGELEQPPELAAGGEEERTDSDWRNKVESNDESSPAGDLDWIKDLGDNETTPAVGESEDLDWIKNLGGTDSVLPSDSDEDFDWIKDLGSPSQSEEPDWMKASTQPEDSMPSEAKDEQPEWVREGAGESASLLDLGKDEEPEQSDEAGEEMEQPASTASTTDFDFLNKLTEEPILETPPDASSATDQDRLGVSDQERDDSFAWLESLAAKQGATEGLLTNPEDRLEEEPEWVKQARGLKDESLEETSESQLAAEEKPIAGLEDLGKSEEDQDDSFAWLENLAARQGATEGLLTRPEERREEEPEWVKRAKDLSAQEPQSISTSEPEPELDQPAASGETEAEQPLSMGASETDQPAAASETQPEQPVVEDEVETWLRNLDAQDPSSDATAETVEPRQELPAAEEEIPSGQPGDEGEVGTLLEDIEQQDQPAVPVADMTGPETEEPAPLDETEIWLSTLGEEKPGGSAADETAIWLKRLDEEETKPVEQAEAADSDLPSWMKDIEEEKTTESDSTVPEDEGELESTWMPPAEEPAPAEEAKAEEEQLPSWLSELDQEEEQISTSSDEEDLPAWLRSEETAPAASERALASDWKSADERIEEPASEPSAVTEEPEPAPMPPVSLEMPDEKLVEDAQEERQGLEPAPVMESSAAEPDVVKPQEPVAESEGLITPSVDPVLEAARNELSNNNIQGALDSYGKLIKKSRYLDEAIYDLREALYRHPVDVNIWQSLGDAYMRANRLQDALDAYTKAEELLR